MLSALITVNISLNKRWREFESQQCFKQTLNTLAVVINSRLFEVLDEMQAEARNVFNQHEERRSDEVLVSPAEQPVWQFVWVLTLETKLGGLILIFCKTRKGMKQLER